MKNVLTDQLYAAKLNYNNAVIEAEKTVENTITTLVASNDKISLQSKDNPNIVFDWYNEYTDSIDVIQVSHIEIDDDDIDGTPIQMIYVYDIVNNTYDLSELPTDAQIEIAERVIQVSI